MNIKSVKTLLPLLTILIVSFGFISKDSIDGLKITFRDVYEEELYYNENDYTSNPTTNYGSTGINIPNPTSVTIPTGGFPSITQSKPYSPNDGMKFMVLDMTLENTGTSDCTFDLKDIYISTEKDSLYPLLGMTGKLSTATRIKPNKKLKRSTYFEIPKEAQPNELYIEDRRIKIVKENTN